MRLRSNLSLVALVVVLVLPALCGCNRYTRIETRDGESVRLIVQSSDAQTVRGIARDRSPVEVAREDIATVTYPGNVATTLYGILAGVGLGIAGMGALFALADENDVDGARLAAGVLMITGGAMALGGLGPLSWYWSQRRDARDIIEGGVEPTVSVSPMLATAPGGAPGGGLALGVRW